MEVPWLTSREEKVFVAVMHRANICLSSLLAHSSPSGVGELRVNDLSLKIFVMVRRDLSYQASLISTNDTHTQEAAQYKNPLS